jgi:hypothetical protein
MDRVLQAQENALNAFQENIQPGRVAGLLLYFNGTNKSGITADADDLGNIVIKRNGETIVNRPAGVFADMGNIRAGSNLFSSTEGGAFVASVFIPFYALGLEQAMKITGPSELNFDYQPKADTATNFSAMTLSVYSVVSFKQERYQYFILGEDQTPAAAVTARPYQLNRDNVTEIYLRNPDSVLSSVGLKQNGEQRFSDQPLNVLKAGTLYDNMLEQNDTDMVELQAYTFGEPASTLNNKSIIELSTSGAGTVEITVCSIRWTRMG